METIFNSEGDIFSEYSPAMGYFYRIFPCHGIFLQNIPLPWDIFAEYSPVMGYHFYSTLINQSNCCFSGQDRIREDITAIHKAAGLMVPGHSMI